jgi:hypothetical protein
MPAVRRLLAAASLALFGALLAPTIPVRAADQPLLAPTFTVFATREGLVGHRTANGHRIRPRDRFVALPSWDVLASDGGNEFQVRVTYRGRSVVLPVWDVGPWNTHDDYWSPQRRYRDLPVGLPMAQAAYASGYNGGRDEFGRRIRMPNGIDIADGAFWDDLGMTQADWVQVTFLWLGADPGGAVAAQVPGSASASGPIAVEPGALVVDDGTAGYDAEAAVKWYDAPCGLNGRHAWTYGTPDPALSENRARWALTLPGPGFYEVLAYIPACGRPATQMARYRVVRGDVVSEVVIDQRAASGTWASLGVYHMGVGPAAIELSDVTGDDGQAVRFDAVQWVLRHDAAPPDARVTAALLQGDGTVVVRWGGTDDVSGLAAYDVQVRRLPDGGWTDWQSGATVGEAVFVPPGPGAYAFRARARDWAGNVQPWREADDATIELGG